MFKCHSRKTPRMPTAAPSFSLSYLTAPRHGLLKQIKQQLQSSIPLYNFRSKYLNLILFSCIHFIFFPHVVYLAWYNYSFSIRCFKQFKSKSDFQNLLNYQLQIIVCYSKSKGNFRKVFWHVSSLHRHIQLFCLPFVGAVKCAAHY